MSHKRRSEAGDLSPEKLNLMEYRLAKEGIGSSKKARIRSEGQSRRLLREHQGVLRRTIARIWGDVLRLDNVASKDNFFELGGDSIKLTQVVSRLCHEFKTEIPLRLLFEYPSLDVFAEELGKRFSEDKEGRVRSLVE